MASLRKEFSHSFSYDLTGVFIGTQFTTNCRVSTLNQLVSGSKARRCGVKLRWDAELGRFQRFCTSVIPCPVRLKNFVNDDRGTRERGFAIGATGSS